MTLELSDFPLWTKGRYYDDFETGQVFNHHWGRTLRAYDCTLFSSLTLNYTPIYHNSVWALSQQRPAELINPYFVFLLVLGMSVEDTSEGVDGAEGAFLGVKRVEFLSDVVDGDTITASTEVVSKRESASRPHGGIVTWRTKGINQRNEEVLRFERTNLTSKRPARESFKRFKTEGQK